MTKRDWLTLALVSMAVAVGISTAEVLEVWGVDDRATHWVGNVFAAAGLVAWLRSYRRELDGSS